MKVKELIAKLQTLDQERDIWVLYDSFYPEEPDFELATERQHNDSKGEIKIGAYVHETYD